MLELMPRNAIYYFTKAPIQRALNENDLVKNAESYGLKGSTYSQVASAVEAAFKNASENDMIFIGGSAFVVAEALNHFLTERN